MAPRRQQPYRDRITIRLDPKTGATLDALATRTGDPVSTVARKLLARGLARPEPEPEPDYRRDRITRRARELRDEGLAPIVAIREATREVG